jgi:Rieske Fe-S protein
VGGGGFSLMHLLQKAQPINQQASKAQRSTVAPSPTEVQPTLVPSPTAKTKATAKATIHATPTTAPTSTPTPGHIGTVIGSTNQPINSAIAFGGNWLIHLGNGSFVAYRNACTHEGVSLRYDSATQHLLCTRHNAAFNPASNGAVLYGPPPSPLPRVAIRVNSDGTITM